MSDTATSSPELPDYETMLRAYHSAFATELKRMVDSIPIRPDDRVLDVACGDGFYTSLLADRLGDDGHVVAVDLSEDYLDIARSAARRSESRAGRSFTAARIEALPFPDDSFDLAWCAQSLYSLPEPVEAVRQMARVVRPEGIVAVLEADTLHHVLLPWPMEVELVVRAAEMKAIAERSKRPRKFYVGRRLLGVFQAAGLTDIRVSSHASDRQAPLGEAERTFLAEYLRRLRETLDAHLEPEWKGKLDDLMETGGDDSLLDRPDVVLTCIDHVVIGHKPVA